ncbi:hypothetical protein C8R46DRAFT_1350573 [Mycena filopes]|nr:hypothetical protein C8R46DRAFT_1350573 [Mycena filopes]
MRFLSDDRKLETRAPIMKVIGAGLPRCATSSLQAAFESSALGYEPCMHMAHVAPHADRLQLTIDCMNELDTTKRRKLLHKLFNGYAATCDFPGIMFVDDLMDMYPDAAVVLNQRKNGKEWADSILSSHSFFDSYYYLIPCFLWKTDRLHWQVHQTAKPFFKRRFGTSTIMTPEFYDIYNAWVRSEAKSRGKSVLEFQARDGYSALCEFLGKPEVPAETKFPHLNDAASFTFLKRILVARGLVAWAALGVTIWAGWKYSPRLVEVVKSFL